MTVCLCACVPVFPCFRVPVFPRARVSVCPCARVPVCPCARVPSARMHVCPSACDRACAWVLRHQDTVATAVPWMDCSARGATERTDGSFGLVFLSRCGMLCYGVVWCGVVWCHHLVSVILW